MIPFHGWKETTFEFRGLSPKPVSGNAANRDSINVKIFEEKGVGFGEGEEKPFSRRVLLPLPNLHFTPYRSVQLTQGSMLLTMTGMSASWQSFIMTVRASQFM